MKSRSSDLLFARSPEHLTLLQEKSDKDGNENKTGSSERRNQTVKRTDMEFVDQEYTLKG